MSQFAYPTHSESRWFVILSKPRQEAQALKHLGYQEYLAWYPTFTYWKHLRAKGWVITQAPLFPRYLFVRPGHPEQSIAPIRSTFGVSGMVRFGGTPAMIGQDLLDNLHQLEQQIAHQVRQSSDPFEPGQKVSIVHGPFAGMVGIVSHHAKERVAVLLELLGRQQAIAIAPGQLQLHPK